MISLSCGPHTRVVMYADITTTYVWYQCVMISLSCAPHKCSVIVAVYFTAERGSSAVECRTCNQVNPGSNPPFATVSKIGTFSFSP